MSTPADNIATNATPTTHSTHLYPSESPSPGPLNQSLAQRSFSSFPATISPFDVTSFTTASQQTWLPPPASQASRQSPLPLSQTEFAPPQADFVLFDPPTEVSRPQRRPSAPPPGHSFNQQHFYANSAPSSSVGFHQQRNSTRPPVPLFSGNSTPNIHHQLNHSGNMADINVAYDSMGSGLGPAYGHLDNGADMWDFQAPSFTPVNDASTTGSTRTVSPKDIFQDPLASAPPSTAFTNLTSPDIGDSPFITDSYDTSPLFQDTDLQNSDPWFTLFPENTDNVSQPASNPMERAASSNSMTRSSSSSTNSPVVLDGSHRRKSSVQGSPATHSAANGVKARRRKGPLPPIAVDPSDKVALKRARNTLAARDSRQRKFDHVLTLEKKNAELESEVEKWRNLAFAHGYNGS